MYASSLASFINIGFLSLFFFFFWEFSESFVMGVISIWGLLQHCWTDRMWLEDSLDMYISWNDIIIRILLLMIHHLHHQSLRIILWFWEWRNFCCTLIYYIILLLLFCSHLMFLDHVSVGFKFTWCFHLCSILIE